MDCGETWYLKIKDLTEDEHEWLDCTLINIVSSIEDDEPIYPDWITGFVIDEIDNPPDVRLLPDSVIFTSEGDSAELKELHVAILRRFLEHFRPSKGIVLEYSFFNSRGTEHGGGVFAITPEDVVHTTTFDWASDQIEDHVNLEVL